MADFLAQMAASSRERADAAGSFEASDFDKPVVPLTLDGFDVIAELKDRSPAEGALKRASGNRAEQARRYVDGGAAAISVLTEPTRFDGSLEHLAAVSAACPDTPVMRKDFLVDAKQVLEARKAGASGVLLIATMLDDLALRSLLDCAWEHGMFVLLESFDAEDLRRSNDLLQSDGDRARSGQLLFGVNTRNLRTLEVDGNRLAELSNLLPSGFCVAESGLKVAADAARVAKLGYRLALVGTALMRSDAPAELIAAMRADGTEALAA